MEYQDSSQPNPGPWPPVSPCKIECKAKMSLDTRYNLKNTLYNDASWHVLWASLYCIPRWMSSSFAETFPHCRNSGEWVGRRRRSRSRSAPIIHRKRCERGEENAVGKSDTSMLTKIILFFALICVQNIIWRYNSTDMHCFLSRKSCLTRMKDGEDHRKNVQPNLAVYPKSSRNSWQLLECLMAWEQNSRVRE